MNQDSEVDRLVKVPMLTDMTNLLCLKPYKRLSQKAKLTRTGQRFLEEMGKQKNKLTTVKEMHALTMQNFKQILKAEDYLTLFDFADEYSRRGNFRLAFPTVSTVQTLESCFELERANNLLLWKYLEWRSQDFDLLVDVCRYN